MIVSGVSVVALMEQTIAYRKQINPREAPQESPTREAKIQYQTPSPLISLTISLPCHGVALGPKPHFILLITHALSNARLCQQRTRE